MLLFLSVLFLAAIVQFNQNTGFSSTSTANSFTETHVNRLSRYYLRHSRFGFKNLQAKDLHKIIRKEDLEEKTVTRAASTAAREKLIKEQKIAKRC